MKNVYKLLVAGICVMTLASCGDNFLTRDPYGSTITQGQYEKLANQLEGSMRGIYSMMYEVSDHDQFGKRSIDMYTDLMCGDMALTNYTYGWFYNDEQGLGRTSRTGYIWYYYYGMLHNVNAVLNAAQGGNGSASADNVIKRIAAVGLPNTVDKSKEDIMYYRIQSTNIDTTLNGVDTTIVRKDTLASFTEVESVIADCYAQALTMRGFIYSNLLMLYCEVNVNDFKTELAFPLYNESNMNEAQPLATMSAVYTQVESDLTEAIDYFDAFSEIEHSSKLIVDKSIASAILAYSYLNKGNTKRKDDEAYVTAYGNALKYAKMAIESSKCQILPRASLFETGFNNVSNVSWMWGQNVTVETAGGLASWFGQCDIHSYSYAWSGDTKAIDANLYKLIPDFDARKQWFNDGSANATYKLCPDGKFFSASNPTSTKADDIDREWLSDNVFMRIESMYLTAAEASYRLHNEGDALNYLTAITDQRLSADTTFDVAAAYSAYKATLTDKELLKAIEYNWRVEMWGEGYGLQTFRRLSSEVLGENERKRGENHSANPGSKITATSEYTFQMPAAEGSYNPSINTTKLPEYKQKDIIIKRILFTLLIN